MSKTNVQVETTPTFTLEKLRKNCATLFNVSSAAFDGATMELAQDKQYTVKEIVGVIEKWSKKEAR